MNSTPSWRHCPDFGNGQPETSPAEERFGRNILHSAAPCAAVFDRRQQLRGLIGQEVRNLQDFGPLSIAVLVEMRISMSSKRVD